VGDFGLAPNTGNEFGKTLEEIVMEAVADYDFPVVFNFPAGHTSDNRSLILGSYVDVKAGPRKSKISFR
jgi:muramoyltetrapeptide carboxypeptidase